MLFIVGAVFLAGGLFAWRGASYFSRMMKESCDQASSEACEDGCVCPSGAWYHSQVTKYKAIALALLLLAGAFLSAGFDP